MKRTAKPKGKDVLLHDLIPPYVEWRNTKRPIGRELKPRTAQHMHDCIRALEVHLGRAATVADLRVDTVNGFLGALLAAGRSPSYASTCRIVLGMTWRYAVKQKLTRTNPDDVRTIHRPKLQPRGYGPDEMKKLLVAAHYLAGRIHHTRIPRRLFWLSLIPAMWDCGWRIGDFIHIEVAHFDPQGRRLFCIEGKTGKSGWKPIRPETAEAIAECVAADPHRKFIWPLMTSWGMQCTFKKLAERAGLPGSSKWVRRGAASAVEGASPGMGWRFLNHSSPGVFEGHYHDTEISGQKSPLPPTIAEPKADAPRVPAAMPADAIEVMDWV